MPSTLEPTLPSPAAARRPPAKKPSKKPSKKPAKPAAGERSGNDLTFLHSRSKGLASHARKWLLERGIEPREIPIYLRVLAGRTAITMRHWDALAEAAIESDRRREDTIVAKAIRSRQRENAERKAKREKLTRSRGAAEIQRQPLTEFRCGPTCKPKAKPNGPASSAPPREPAPSTALTIAPGPDLAPLSAGDRDRLENLEHVIEGQLEGFVAVGRALAEIRDRRLYRESHASFDGYCRERWDFQKAYAHRLVASAETVATIQQSPIGDRCKVLPATESQARPLTAVPEAKRPKLWEKAVRQAPVIDGLPRVTAAIVQRVVDEAIGTGRKVVHARVTGKEEGGRGKEETGLPPSAFPLPPGATDPFTETTPTEVWNGQERYYAARLRRLRAEIEAIAQARPDDRDLAINLCSLLDLLAIEIAGRAGLKMTEWLNAPPVLDTSH